MKQEHAIDLRKAAIIGCGFVGSATAFTLMQSKLFSELVLIDVDKASFHRVGEILSKICFLLLSFFSAITI